MTHQGQPPTVYVGVGKASRVRGWAEERAHDGEEGVVQDVPEVRGNPIRLPPLIELVCDFVVHLVRDPSHAHPHHQRERVGEAPAVTSRRHG